MNNFKPGDTVQVVTLDDLPEESDRYEKLGELQLDTDYEVEDIWKNYIRIKGEDEHWYHRNHFRLSYNLNKIDNLSQQGEQC